MPDNCKVLTDASQTIAEGDRVVMLRPRWDLRGGKAGGIEAEDQQGEDDENYRMLTNIIGMALVAILIGAGVWLTNAIADIGARTG
jgi:hypothetical protein